MAFISYADGGTLSPELTAAYDKARDPRHGVVPNIMRIHSRNPGALAAHLELYRALMFEKSELTPAQREMIAVVVSQINQCHY